MRNIAIAIALALIAALLTTFYVSNYKRSVQQSETDVRVYVAARDIPSGITGAAALRRNLIQPRDVARRTVVPGAISEPGQVSTMVVTDPVFAGEQVTLRRFSAASERGIRGQLKGTIRAIQVPGDANQLLAGLLRPGDRVDLVASLGVDQGGHAARIVLRDVNVLRAADAGVDVDQRVASQSVLLAVRDTQVQRLFFVLKNADWSLQLRPSDDAADSRDLVETDASVLAGGGRRG
jgi:pilus assembly protein CpaB